MSEWPSISKLLKLQAKELGIGFRFHSPKGTKCQRIITALLTPPVAFVCVLCLLATNRLFASVGDLHPSWGILIAHVLWMETFGAFTIFLIGAFIWAVFKPAWSERLLAWAGKHVVHIFFVLGITFFVLLYFNGE